MRCIYVYGFLSVPPIVEDGDGHEREGCYSCVDGQYMVVQAWEMDRDCGKGSYGYEGEDEVGVIGVGYESLCFIFGDIVIIFFKAPTQKFAYETGNAPQYSGDEFSELVNDFGG